MDLKFYLNKFIKADGIENYTLKSLYELKQSYDKFLEDSEGFDPDFPGISFKNKGKSVTKGLAKADSGSSTLESFSLSKSSKQ